ncbi:MAG: hypothetical protein GF350_10110, partial [Chitinivibrionales bacterium]|nr:hypothetical protein [Chitinivibrionales bacterium]
ASAPQECDFKKLNCDIGGALLTPEKEQITSGNRKLPRVSLLPQLKVLDRTSREQFGTLVDVSQQGIKICTFGPVQPGGMFQFDIHLPKAACLGEMIRLDARSIWCRPDVDTGYFFTGFEIEQASLDDITTIEKLMDMQQQKNAELEDA